MHEFYFRSIGKHVDVKVCIDYSINYDFGLMNIGELRKLKDALQDAVDRIDSFLLEEPNT
jgi:hypothetical protein